MSPVKRVEVFLKIFILIKGPSTAVEIIFSAVFSCVCGVDKTSHSGSGCYLLISFIVSVHLKITKFVSVPISSVTPGCGNAVCVHVFTCLSPERDEKTTGNVFEIHSTEISVLFVKCRLDCCTLGEEVIFPRVESSTKMFQFCIQAKLYL